MADIAIALHVYFLSSCNHNVQGRGCFSKLGTFRASRDTYATVDIRNKGLKAKIIWISLNVVSSGKVKSVSLVRRRLAQIRASSQIKLDEGILFPSIQSRSSPKFFQYCSLG